MKNIVFLGAKKIGLDCLSFLNVNRRSLDINIIGVLTNARGTAIKSYCEENDIPLISSLSDYLELTSPVNLAISVQYHEILKKVHICKAELTINLHMAPLPEYRGCNQFSLAIINGDSEFGTTIHVMNEKIDDGDIIYESRFSVPDNCWVEELYLLTESKSLELFRNSIKSILDRSFKLKKQEEFFDTRSTSLNFRKDIEKMKFLDLNWNSEKIERHIRGTYMPGFAPPYFLIAGKKVYIKREE